MYYEINCPYCYKIIYVTYRDNCTNSNPILDKKCPHCGYSTSCWLQAPKALVPYNLVLRYDGIVEQ